MTQISIRLPEEDADAIDGLVREGRYPTRTAFLAQAARIHLDAERERQVAESYRRAYTDQPPGDDETWVQGAGSRTLAEHD